MKKTLIIILSMIVFPFLCFAEDDPEPTPEEIEEVIRDIEAGASGEVKPWPFG